MRTDKARQKMVADVQAFFAASPSLLSIQEAELPADKAHTLIEVKSLDEADYVSALYEACAKGFIVGRSGNRLIVKLYA